MTDTVVVKTEQGDLRGRKLATNEGVTYYSFQGIPYAKPPVGTLRFKAPEPPETWTGVRNAFSLGNVAPHFDIFKSKLVGNEDCLFLNVYTPQIEPRNPIPVMVWIHGGGFQWGSGNTDIYGPQPLIREGVILVTLNYRLSALGFLDVSGTDVSSNNGLKDQAAALRWVQKNISCFGGDKNNVTIFGESAGSFSVHYHVLSPISKGLFHKAIAMSGSALSMKPQPSSTNTAFALGKEVGYNGENAQALVEFLQTLPAETIIDASVRLMNQQGHHMGVILEEPGENAFITEDPLKIIRSGNYNHVPIMAGATSAEGKLYYLMPRILAIPLSGLNKNFEALMPVSFKLRLGPDQLKDVAQKMKKFYFGDKDICEETKDKLFDYLGDMYLMYGINEMVKEHACRSSPVFYYLFSFEGKFSFMSLSGKTSPGQGAGHGDELFYLFQSDVVDNKFKPGTPEHEVSTNISKLWANFAKYGNPSVNMDVEWIPATKDDLCYLDINTELNLNRNLFKERMEFWKQLYSEILGNH